MIKRIAACMLAIALATWCASATAQRLELPKDLLTLEQEATAGEWINLFDGETLFGWQVVGDTTWKVTERAATCERGTGGALLTTTPFGDFALLARVRVKPGTQAALVVRAATEGNPWQNGATIIPLQGAPEWQDIAVAAEGTSVKTMVNGAAIDPVVGKRTQGYIGVLYYAAGGLVEVAQADLRPLNLRQIFNGKDLTGWNIIPGHASQFAVDNGALRITNGNGQIETAETFQDFLLQLDILSNGDRLNSGVFFRGPVGVFWKGYESQVRNEWADGDRTKPVDFGTGGIYALQPARRVVPSDRQWFTKTVVCTGNHIAVWVNGYQVSDYTDVRAVAANGDGKAGFVPTAGTIHLQGHDPTTDLSFKKIGVQTY